MHKRLYHTLLWMMSFALLLPSFILPAHPPVHAAVQPSNIQSPSADPIPVVNDIDFTEWTIDNGMLYWANSCPGGEFIGDGYLKRKALNGGSTKLVAETTSFNCDAFRNMVADETGIYYYSSDGFNGVLRGIHHRPPGNSSTAPPEQVFAMPELDTLPMQGTRMALSDTHVYWLTRDFNVEPRLLRHLKDGSGSVETVANIAKDPKDLLIVGNTLYWFDSTGLWSTDTTSCSALPCDKTNIVPNVKGDHLVYHYKSFLEGSQLYWVESNPTQRIRRRTCTPTIVVPVPTLLPPIQPLVGESTVGGSTVGDADVTAANPNTHNATAQHGIDSTSLACSFDTVYTAPTDRPWRISRPATDGTNIFWRENYFETFTDIDGRLRRKPLANGEAVDIAVNLGGGFAPTELYNGYVYFPFEGMKKLPWNAPPIERDLAANSIEVTQGIQSLNNDVPLVANKETYVRVYGRQNSGPDAVAVKAHLHGTRNGNPLPGSPLNSINGSLKFAMGAVPDRAKRDDGWLFHLPNSWTNEGSVNFELIVDQFGTYSDPNLGNNSLSRTVNFEQKAPICMVSVPVRTHAPAANSSLASFWPMVDLAEQMLPTTRIKTYKQNSDIAELEVCWWGPFPHPCHGPYELPDDDWKIMASLWIRDAFSDDPDSCDDANAVTHYVGLIHPSTGGSFAGMGNRPGANLALKMPPLDAVPLNWRKWSNNEPRGARATTLAHEFGHNYNRKHVDCNGPKDPDSSYPYDPCKLDDGPLDAASTHFVWDVQHLEPIAPDDASDLMSYQRPRFPSDYTWKAIFNRIDNNVAAASISAASFSETMNTNSIQAAVAAKAFNQADNIVLVTGAYTPTNIAENGGLIDYAYVLPKNQASAGQLRKWQREMLSGLTASGHNHDHAAQDDTVLFRLLDAGDTVLAEQPAVVLELEDNKNEQLAVAATIPEPTGDVATVQLVVNGIVVASRTPGATFPTMELTLPAGGESVDQELTVTWTASDADNQDRLLYVVQYSHDNGGHWRTVSSGIAGPGNEQGDNVLPVMVKFNASDLPGSNGQNALVRVFASDGYHTISATSQSFSVTTRKPEPYIISPAEGNSIPADQPLLLRGGAGDAEDGRIDADKLSWSVNGTDVGTGESQVVMGLGPGQHTIVLTAEDSDGNTATLERTVTVRPLEIVSASAPALDGFCDDVVYADGTELNLMPYEDGSQATVQMVRAGSSLYACFHNMKQGALNPGAFAGVRIDKDNSRDELAQADDYGFFISEDGGQFTYAGDGSGGMAEEGPDGLVAQISIGDNSWAAEIRIDIDTIDGWDHPVRLNLGHYWVDSQDDDYEWPYATTWNRPDTWAETAFGTTPKILGLTPSSLLVGDGPATVVVSGTGFTDGAIVRWNEVDLATQFGSSSAISATLSADQLAAAGIGAIVVRNPSALESAAVRLKVAAPAINLSAVSPDKVNAGSQALRLTITGSGFVDGAEILWDGAVLNTTYVNETQVEADIEAIRLNVGGAVNVAVRNPGIASDTSNALPFVISPQVVNDSTVYLPVMTK